MTCVTCDVTLVRLIWCPSPITCMLVLPYKKFLIHLKLDFSACDSRCVVVEYNISFY